MPGAPAQSQPVAPTPSLSGASVRYTRGDIIRLGRSSEPWAFLPVGVAALRAAPGDAGVRFLFASALGRLGLRTLAIEQLALLSGEAAADPAVSGLRDALRALPDDEMPANTRRATLAANLQHLGSRGTDLLPIAERWVEQADHTQVYRTLDRNAVRRERGDANPSNWLGLIDHQRAAREFVARNIAPLPKPRPAIVLEGIDPPWLADAIARALGAEANGYQPRLILLQADPVDALHGLSLAPLEGLLASPRTMLLAGRDASERLARWARSDQTRSLTGRFVRLAGTRTLLGVAPESAMQAAIAAQSRLADELRSRVMSRDEQRTPDAIASRLATAIGGDATARSGWAGTASPDAPVGPLRVLIPTSRYTTFLRHAASDLADTLRRMGHTAEILLEPDDHTQFSTVAYLDAIDRLDPDLIVFINYARAQFPGVTPPNVPVVCWVQDMMPHLFSRDVGRAMGPLDFVAGHCAEDLFEKHGYPRDRAVVSPVVASDTKFHPAPVAPALRERFACEIACVTHHSETVEAMHARLKGEAFEDPAAARVLDALLPRCLEIARATDRSPWKPLRDAVREELARHHPLGPDDRIEGLFFRNYALPIADRAFRHEALAWAASIADRRGWRLRLHGKGWESHPTLARHAAGLTEHGEELRACYQCARVHLHLCLTALMHQRPMECALSGGLPIVRPTRESLSTLHGRAQRSLLERGATPMDAEPGDADAGPLYSFADAPEAMAFAAQTQRLGFPLLRPGILLNTARVEALRRRAALERVEMDPTWLFGDLAEVSFHDEATLEALIERAIERPDWRRAVSDAIAARVRERLTHTALARRLLVAIRDAAADRAGDQPSP
ncbi:MAG: hypothetical protein KDA05_04340 [Phycisphaerales bacterium]|nr:hypothetical protein [Phycisphaerales bacterium]MCB9841201.1 hypothetical protein [Phycisphaeraceae bacterium]